MLIAVSERRREIGVRRAVGATRADVMFQFLVEAAVIAAFGGIVGVLLGIGGSILVIVRQQLPAVIVWEAVVGALVISVTIGLIFGLQPAWKAANVDPIESLRA
jgi:putative ABC transport system permease protein